MGKDFGVSGEETVFSCVPEAAVALRHSSIKVDVLDLFLIVMVFGLLPLERIPEYP